MEVLEAIATSPLPTILGISGSLFLLLALAGGVRGRVIVDIPPDRQKGFVITGIGLVFLAAFLYLLPLLVTPKPPPTPTLTPSPSPTSTATLTPSPLPTVTPSLTFTSTPTPIPTATATSTPVPTPTVTATSTPVPPTDTPPPTGTATPTPTETPSLARATANITSPQDGAAVGESVAVRGTIAGLRPDQRAFLCVQSTVFGRLIFPQGEIYADPSGYWVVESIYRSVGYDYETYVIVTDNPDSAEMLADQYYRGYGMKSLPSDTFIASRVIVVTRK
jgi:hypothetical protein